jgi:undecaprenyl pyrophosphate phosphatase UppP
MKKSNYFVGLLLIAVGFIVIILKALFNFKVLELSTDDFWVLIVLLMGLSFEFAFFLAGKYPGLLVPGGIITTIALLFMFEVATDWSFTEYTWPIYILSVAIGLFQMYLFSRREKGLLISSLIIGGVSAFFIACTFIKDITSILRPEIFIPVALISGGIALLCSSMSRKKSGY